jgi:hypothetical protein
MAACCCSCCSMRASRSRFAEAYGSRVITCSTNAMNGTTLWRRAGAEDPRLVHVVGGQIGQRAAPQADTPRHAERSQAMDRIFGADAE